MHPGQLEISQELAAQLVARLLPGTHPRTVRLLEPSATTSTVARIGEGIAARFPLGPSDPVTARAALVAEHEAMGEFAAVCPLPAPEPVALGEPSAAFPMPLSVQTWVPGEVADPEALASSDSATDDLADLLLALRAVPTSGRRFRGPGRGGDLTAHEDWVRTCLEHSRDPAAAAPPGQLGPRVGARGGRGVRAGHRARLVLRGLKPGRGRAGRSTCQRLLEDPSAAAGA